MKFEMRAGHFMNQPSGYKSFVPKDLPPDPPIEYDNEMLRLLSDADRKLGRLDGITQILPNPDLFVAMYVQKEAVLSSQIEGTQASLSDLLDADSSAKKQDSIKEVVNYVGAMYYGLERLEDFPLCLRLFREIHAKLLEGSRGSERNPGEFRKSQNWIGPEGCTLQTASFVPPVVPDMMEALNNLEKFIQEDHDMPALVKIALIHAQFETIHPFLDGNGRVGRLLITFWLCYEGILSQPLLYLSYYFKQNRLDYYDRLMEARKKGDWENWIKFFLTGVAIVADEATETATSIINMKEKYGNLEIIKNNANYQKLLEALFEHPIVTKKEVAKMLDIAHQTASTIVAEFCSESILVDVTPEMSRNKRFSFAQYISLLNRGTELNR